MRYQGRITNWKDDQGFGFITPNGGGTQVFVHIKSFSGRKRRPAGDELVTYQLTTDPKGRVRAENVFFVGDRSAMVASSGGGAISLTFATLFVVSVVAAVLVGKLPWMILGLYLAASVVTFFAYALDKSAARTDGWRIRESTLHMFGVMGGWPGALAAQRLLRHKSRKQTFQVVFWATVLLNFGALGWFL